MGASLPGPMCHSRQLMCIDDGTLVRQCSRPPVVAGAAVPSSRSVSTLILDEDQVIGFLRSVARARALERHVKMYWKSYDDDAVLNFIYTVMWWKGHPGTVEVDTGDPHKIDAETDEGAEQLLDAFLDRAALGPIPTRKFLEVQESVRALALGTVQSVFQEAADLNNEVIDAARSGIQRLTVIKCASTITLKTAALFGGGVPAFLIGTGYDLTLQLIKDWDKAPDAKLVGVTSKTGDKLWKKGAKDVAKNLGYIFKGEEADHVRKIEKLEKRLDKMEQGLKGASERKIGQYQRRLTDSRSLAAKARIGRQVMTGVKFIFYAFDVYSAVKDARDTLHQAGR